MAGEIVYSLRDAVISFADNDSPANTLTVAADEGNLKFTVAKDVRQIMQRGDIDTLRKGAEKVIPLSFTLKYTELVGATCTPWEFMMGTGNASAFVYTAKTGAGYDLADAGDVNVFTVVFTISQVPSGSEVITFPNCFLESVPFSEGDDYDTLEWNLICTNQMPIIT